MKVTRDSDDPQQLQQLRQASMESERSNDNRKKMNKLIEQQLLVSGQVEKQVFEKVRVNQKENHPKSGVTEIIC